MQVLKDTGLKQAIDRDTFGFIARYIDEQWQLAISGDAREPTKDAVWDLAMLACTCFKENASSLHDNTLYQELKQLTFVPATKVDSKTS